MVSTPTKSFVSNLLLRWYGVLAVLVACAVWASIALALWPLQDADGTYASRPYGLSTGLENKALDLLFQLRDVRHPSLRTRGLSEPITIIEIDQRSIKESKVRPQTWPRDWYARLVDRASKGGASVIGLDIFLSEKGGDSPRDDAGDLQLAQSMKDAGIVVIPNKLAAGDFEEITPLPLFRDAAYGVGFADVPLDGDQFLRSMPLVLAKSRDDVQFSFATRLAEGYLSAKGLKDPFLTSVDDQNARLGDRNLPLRNDRFFQLDFRARPPAFRHVSAAEIFGNSQLSDEELFHDRIVLIGSAYIDAPDLFSTPFYEPLALTRLLDRAVSSGPVRTPGIEIHAATVATMLFGRSPVRPGYFWQVSSLIFPLGLVCLAIFRLRVLWGLLVLIIMAVTTLALSSWAFNAKGLILPLASAWLGMGLLTPLGLGLRYARERVLHARTEAERAHVRDILSRCVSEEVADELWQQRDQIMSGERRVVSIIFTDIRNFTSHVEDASSDQVVVWLNDYFSRMHAIVTRHCGHINKFIGDGLMIVFGAPISRTDPEEARAAVDCGLEMLAEVDRMNSEWQGTGRPEIKIGVGITTGEATCGVVGAERRLEYTIIGDVVNLSARLEATTKDYEVPLLISEATAQLLGDEYETRALGEVKVKGKQTKTKIFTVNLRRGEVKTSTPVAIATETKEATKL